MRHAKAAQHETPTMSAARWRRSKIAAATRPSTAAHPTTREIFTPRGRNMPASSTTQATPKAAAISTDRNRTGAKKNPGTMRAMRMAAVARRCFMAKRSRAPPNQRKGGLGKDEDGGMEEEEGRPIADAC